MPFITNTAGTKNLAERLNEIIEKSSELKFLVGFFYFSGIQQLYETLRKLYEEGRMHKEFLKILVGLNVDVGTYGLYEYAKNSSEFREADIKEEFFKSLKKAFNSKDTDKKEIYEQFDFFLNLLKERKIVMRKTLDPNHAKLYLFKLDDKITPNLFITGSSNLTKSGLTSQKEFDVEIKDFGFKEAEKYFDELWEESVEIEPEDIQKVIRILKNETHLKEVTPFEAWVYLLKLYIETHLEQNQSLRALAEKTMDEAGYKPYEYQIDAVLQAIKMIESHGGVILADVVGLGKTVVACCIAKVMGKKGIVICPPHLIGDENKTFGWRKYLEDFGLDGWEVRSIGKLEETLEFVRSKEEKKNIDMVIIDEAHRFRNENTQRYHYLHEITRGKDVIMLTATPFNNRPSDIFALLKLFTVPKKSSIVLDENLESKFEEYEILFERLSYIKNYHNSPDPNKRGRAREYYYKIFGERNIELSKVNHESRELARKIRGVLEPIVIRRNRLDLKYYKEKIDIPEVKDPQERFFALTKEQSEFYDQVIELFRDYDEGGKFTGAIYFPIRYELGDLFHYDILSEKLPQETSFMFLFQRNLYNFMRRLLVKRFESSFGAFEKSVIRFRELHKQAIEFVEKTNKFILNRKLMEEILEEEDDDKIEEKLKEYEEELKSKNINTRYHKVYEIKNFKKQKEFLENLKKDLRLFEYILGRFNDLDLKSKDPKARELVKCIKEFLDDGVKVAVFTEYMDTAEYIAEILEENFKNRVLHAFGNLSKGTIEAIYKNFDASYKHRENQYLILLATDKISEGFNLNRAGVVINYDIPWNPVRVIQRVGRINRISKKEYDKIHIVNFFPTEQGANIVKSREIASNKIFMIHKVLGEDSKIFSPDEEPEASRLYKKLTEYKEDEDESFISKVRREFQEIVKNNSDTLDEIRDMPYRIKLAKSGKENELFVFIKKGNDIFIGKKDYKSNKISVVSFDEVYDRVKVGNRNESRLKLSDKFWESYHAIIEKRFFDKRNIPKATDTKTKARNLLKSILQMLSKEELKEKVPENIKRFVSDLIDDINHYGTLSEYILSDITKWESFWKSGNHGEIIRRLKQLMKEIGDNFIEKAKRNIKDIQETVIIAIENRKENE